MKRTAIIIPTYNLLDECLKPCIESIMRYTNLEADNGNIVVVVANGCVDGTAEYLRGMASIHPWLYFIIVDEQLGYTKAINKGIKYALDFEYIDNFVLLNNDTVLMEQPRNQWIDMLQSGLDMPKAAVSGVVKKNEEATGLPFIIFFCAMVSREAFETLGLMDEEFSPGFGEDVDFCMRAEQSGYITVQVPLGFEPRLEGGRYVCHFPIYHVGTKSFHEYEGYSEIVHRNIETLRRKYLNK